jgi:hypothetical protein
VSALALAARPFYSARLDSRGRPRPWGLEELEDFAAERGDPFAGRLEPGAPPPDLSLQLECCDDPPLWLGLSARELGLWSRALAAIWARYGVARRERIAIFDYGSSPLVLLASASYTPHLRRGAAERLGLQVVCNDGVAVLAERMVEIVEQLQPAALVLRRDVLAPLDAALDGAGVSLAGSCRWLAVTEPDGAPDAGEVELWSRRWGVPAHRILRADAGCVLAGDCRVCGAFHLSSRLYRLEATGEGDAIVTTRFARVCPAVRQRIDGAVQEPGACPEEPDAGRLRWL